MTDTLTPFLVQNLNVRGRMTVMDHVIADILNRHNYPAVVNTMLAELILLGTTLAHAFKFDGIFTLQIQGDAHSPVAFMVVDIVCGDSSEIADNVKNASRIRACASVREDHAEKVCALKTAHVFDLFGHGTMSFSLDLNNDATQTNDQRYQGIVELSAPRIHECLQHYFRQSEQLETIFFVSMGESISGRCIMLQTMPFNADEHIEEHDRWTTAIAFLSTLSKDECQAHDPDTLLSRLFKTEGLEVYGPKNLAFYCRCSREKLQPFIDNLSMDEKKSVAKLGIIHVSCDFCSEKYTFPVEEGL